MKGGIFSNRFYDLPIISGLQDETLLTIQQNAKKRFVIGGFLFMCTLNQVSSVQHETQ